MGVEPGMSGGDAMGTTAIREVIDHQKVLESDLGPFVIDELAGIIEEAESSARWTGNEVAPWFYFVPCAGVRYYSYRERPSPVQK